MRNPHRSWSFVLVVVLVGAATAVAAFVVVQTLRNAPPWQGPSATDAPPIPPAPPPSEPPRSPADSATRDQIARADDLLQAGRLEEAQDAYLDVLLTSDPDQTDALNGLIQVRRRATNDNTALLRQQGDAYKAAAARGGDGGEHYTNQALSVLARVSYLAAAQIEVEDNARRSSLAQGPPNRPGPPATSRGAGRAGAPAPNIPATPPASPAAPASPPSSPQAEMPTPAPAPTGPQFIVRVGPLGDPDAARNMATQFQREGLVVRVSTETSESARRYVVVSEPASRQIAETRVRSLAALGIEATIADLEGGVVRLTFGAFSQLEEAGALARHVRARGYPAIVIPEGGTVYFVIIGPHEQPTIDDVIGRLRSGVVPLEVAPSP